MQLSAANCRAEQARHLKLSREDPLPNRRIVAAKAADAWGQEVLRAEEREAKHPAALSKEDAEFARQFAEEADLESDPTEE